MFNNVSIWENVQKAVKHHRQWFKGVDRKPQWPLDQNTFISPTIDSDLQSEFTHIIQ